MNKITVKYEDLLENVNSMRTNYIIRLTRKPKRDKSLKDLRQELKSLLRSRASISFYKAV